MSEILDELARELEQRSRNADPYIIVRPARKRSVEGQRPLVQDIVDEYGDFFKEPESHTQE